MKFRMDINALRAYAVLGVLFYHFNFNIFSGGFAGVDVFFVISGYLMTSIIMNKLNNNNFNFSDFYLSRAKRIIPPLIAMCLTLYILGLFFLNPLDFVQLKKHIYSSVTFVSNYIYWLESGYFSSASKEKWLLHTWSLSVEWQFYLIFPIILTVLFKKFNNIKTLKLVLLFVVIGYFISIYSSNRYPSPNFFFLPTRAWELLAGTCLYFVIEKRKVELSLLTSKALTYIGLLVIVMSYLFLNKNIAWPGYFTLIPVLGACTIIYAGNESSWLIKASVIQWLGRISYSLYLWHWPVAVILYYLELDSLPFQIFGLLLSIFLGFLSYIVFERGSNLFFLNVSSKVRATIYIISIPFFIYGVNFDKNEEFSDSEKKLFNMIASSPLRSECHTGGQEYLSPKLACNINNSKVTWAVIGDSHGVELSYSLAEKLKNNQESVKQFTFSGCIPSYGQDYSFSSCSNWTNEAVKEIINNKDIKNVVVVYRYKAAFHDEKIYRNLEKTEALNKRKQVQNSLETMLSYFLNNGKSVYLITPFPDSKMSVSVRISSSYMKRKDVNNVSLSSRNDYLSENNDFFEMITRTPYSFSGVNIIDITDIFCDKNLCYAVKNGVPLFFDDDHPSLSATNKVAQLLGEKI